MNRDTARRVAIRAIGKERDRQKERFPENWDDAQVEADLLDPAGVLTVYVGHVAEEGMKQREADPVNYKRVANSMVKVAAVASAMVEALLAKGLVGGNDLIDED